MSNPITLLSIDATFPISGQANDTQTFRDNSAKINSNFTTIKNALQNNVLVSKSYSNATVTNDLQGSTIANGLYSEFNGVVYSGSDGAIDVSRGPFQFITLSNNTTLSFTNWTSNSFNQIRLHLKSASSTSYSINVPTNPNVKLSANFPSSFVTGTTSADHVVDVWTYNSGSTVYLNYIGAF